MKVFFTRAETFKVIEDKCPHSSAFITAKQELI